MTLTPDLEKSFSVAELAQVLKASIHGDETCIVNSIAPLDEAKTNQLSFLSSSRFESQLDSTEAGVVIVQERYRDRCSGNALIVDDPYAAYARVSCLFDARRRQPKGIHSSAVVDESAVIDPSASIGANCVIGKNVTVGANVEVYPGGYIGDDVTMGEQCLLHANVSLYPGTQLGNNVAIHANSVIGSDGFGYAPTAQGWQKIAQLGRVIIGDNVEIGASVAIDRGALKNTIIADGVIIDNQVHLAHNVEIGENSAIAGCVGIAGSTTLGKSCTVAGAVAINGHISIADNTHFNGGTIVTKGVDEPGATYASSTPMLDVKKWRRTSVRYSQLDDMAKRITALEKQLSNSSE